MVWYMWVNGMVWYGMVHVGEWYGMVWYGMAMVRLASSDKKMERALKFIQGFLSPCLLFE